ncbi:clp1-related protein, putative [Plasmodium ovale]|uniref:Clp1-related protein, putative n=1 Tax=Plasmodium ovale TaxID=36330 RepID=A0A1D3KXZ8_PLAOA|nr:clp1-related protein, putative [Plasmodium ovale]
MASTGNTRIYHLRAYRELRIVTLEKTSSKFEEKEECIKIRILSNHALNKNEKNTPCTAEIFGKELIVDKDYHFGFNEKFSIYTFTGCVIQIKGKTLQEYESKNSTLKDYLSLSYILDAYRKLAKKKKTVGPRILITGNNNSGKSSVSMLLLNYALKSGFKPIYIETDTKCSCDKKELNKGPGIMSCFVYDNFSTIKFNLDYFFGYLDINEDINLYYHLNECISACIHLMLLNNMNHHTSNFKNNTDQEIIYSSGFILNVPSEADNKVIHSLIEIYNINIVVVIDNSFLHYSLKEKYYNLEKETDSIEKVKWGGGMRTDKTDMNGIHHETSDGYFYKHENGNNPLSCAGERIATSVPIKRSNSSTGNVAGNGVVCGVGNCESNNTKADDRMGCDNADTCDNRTHEGPKERSNGRRIEIVGMPKYEGVIPSDSNRLRYCRNLWFYNYFSKDISINNTTYKKSHILTIKYSSTKFVKLDTKLAVPLSALPADCRNIKRETVSVSLYNGNIKYLSNCILGVSYSKDFHYVHLMNIAAFVHVQNVKEIETEGNITNEEKKDKNLDAQNDYLIEMLCPISITARNIPPYFVIPGNLKQIKF